MTRVNLGPCACCAVCAPVLAELLDFEADVLRTKTEMAGYSSTSWSFAVTGFARVKVTHSNGYQSVLTTNSISGSNQITPADGRIPIALERMLDNNCIGAGFRLSPRASVCLSLEATWSKEAYEHSYRQNGLYRYTNDRFALTLADILPAGNHVFYHNVRSDQQTGRIIADIIPES